METTDNHTPTPEELALCIEESAVRAADACEQSPAVLRVDGSVIGTLGNFSASIGKAKSKKTFNCAAIVASALSGRNILHYKAHLPEGKHKVCTWTPSRANAIATKCWSASLNWPGCRQTGKRTG